MRLTYLTFIVCLTLPSISNAQNNAFHCSQANTLLKMFDKYHYTDLVIDEKVSGEIYDDFVKELDDEAFYLTQNDLKLLAPYRTGIQKDITSNLCKLLEYSTYLLKKKLKFADSLVTAYSKKPIDLSKNENYFTDVAKENTFLANDAALAERWYKAYKYAMLDYIFSHDLKTKSIPEILALEPDIRAKAAAILHRRINFLLQSPEGVDNYVTDIFLNVIALRYDPHSYFLTQKNMQKFREALSKDQYAYGFSSDEGDNGETKITALVPGGAAWKSNQLNVGDVLLKVKFENANPVDISYMSNEELHAIFQSATAKRAEFTVRKANGQIQTVILIKSKIRNDDNIVKGYILEGEKKIGYISLPSFYSNFNGKLPSGCANDVAKELVRLQQEKIEGLILDVRDNGGGSMYEAIDLAGIFIDEGPLGMIKDNQQKISTFNDMNRGAAYSGPLLVLVNNQSASASELLSGILQDYNRAVIVGSTTFGKATVQTTFPMDINYNPNSKTDPSQIFCNQGYTNITYEKFYRVSSKSHQKTGIKPDVEVPQYYNLDSESEATEKYALVSDTVGKTLTYMALPKLPVAALQSNSAIRIKNSNKFSMLRSINDSLKIVENQENSVSLKIDVFKNDNNKYTSLKEKIKTLNEMPSGLYKVANHQDDLDIFKFDADEKSINEQNLKKIQNDFILEEAYAILKDLIHKK